MSGLAGTVVTVILIGTAVGGALVIGAPILAIPLAAAILMMWAGARVATLRGRAEQGQG